MRFRHYKTVSLNVRLARTPRHLVDLAFHPHVNACSVACGPPLRKKDKLHIYLIKTSVTTSLSSGSSSPEDEVVYASVVVHKNDNTSHPDPPKDDGTSQQDPSKCKRCMFV